METDRRMKHVNGPGVPHPQPLAAELPMEETAGPQGEVSKPRRKVRVGSRHFHLPESRGLRITIGVVLVIGGMLGFLPILGFWMIPLGLLVLSYEFSRMRRWRRRGVVWWGRRRGR
jgi:pilus assembly protein TadC